MTHLITTPTAIVRRSRDDSGMTAAIVRRSRDDSGMTTAEYAVGTVSACGFAGVLFKLLTSEFGQTLLQGLFEKVLNILPF